MCVRVCLFVCVVVVEDRESGFVFNSQVNNERFLTNGMTLENNFLKTNNCMYAKSKHLRQGTRIFLMLPI